MFFTKRFNIFSHDNSKIWSWCSWEKMVFNLELKTTMEPIHPRVAIDIHCCSKLHKLKNKIKLEVNQSKKKKRKKEKRKKKKEEKKKKKKKNNKKIKKKIIKS